MDTLKILLGATLALLLGALVVFTNRMNDGVRNAPEEDVAEMRQQLAEIENELERLRLEKERLALKEATRETAPEPVATASPQDVEAMQERLAQLEREAEEARADAERAEAEAGLMNERYAEDRDKSARRARLIRDALLIATIQDWVEDPNLGGFATLDIRRPDNVKRGTVLAIRRNETGILGKLRVGEVTSEGAIANPITRFDEVKPQRGDELILNTVVELAP